MDRNELEGNWQQMKGRLREKWGKLTDDDLERIDGRREELLGKLQERYGKARETIEKELDEFLDKH